MASTILFPSTNPHAIHSKLETDGGTPPPASPLPQKTPNQPGPDPDQHNHRFLPYEEWAQFCRGIGVHMDGGEANMVPAYGYFASRGYPEGLFKDVLRNKSKYNLFTWATKHKTSRYATPSVCSTFDLFLITELRRKYIPPMKFSNGL